MSTAALMKTRRPDVDDADELWPALWEIKKARALDDLLPDPCDLETEFAAFASEAAEWAAATFQAGSEIWPQG